MSTWAAPGTVCVCIDDHWDEGLGFHPIWEPSSRVPMINEVLTIKEVFDDHPLKSSIRGGIAVSFVELESEDCFSLEHFAPPSLDESIDPENWNYESAYDG